MPTIPRPGLLRVLAHPATLTALTVLALNDFVLRHWWPSWLSGKLGDFAWLFASSLIAAVLLSLPLDLARKDLRRSPWPAVAGFALIGGIFALAKTLPSANTLVDAAAGALFGFPVGWRRDPTDLIALLALVPAWLLWLRATRPAPAPTAAGQSARLRRFAALSRPGLALAWLVIPLCAVLTMANGAQPRGDPGVFCLYVDDGVLTAHTGGPDFLSADGGLTWRQAPAPTPAATAAPGASPLPAPTRSGPEVGPWPHVSSGQVLTLTLPPARALEATLEASSYYTPHCQPKNPVTDPADPEIMYRYQLETVIERSTDGGQTWQPEFWLQPLNDIERKLYMLGHRDSPYVGDNTASVFAPRPLDALVDPQTGNALFAMGHQGVLVRAPDGRWWWATLGRYRHLGK